MDEPNFTIRFDVGDIVTDTDEESYLYRRDCIVVYSDALLFTVMSKGVPQMVHFDVGHPTIKLVQKGPGALSEGATELLKSLIKSWPDLAFVQTLPDYVNKQKTEDDHKNSDLMHFTISGFVPKSFVLSWRKFNALIKLAHDSGEEMPKDVDSVIMSWMIVATIRNIPFIRMLQEMKKFNPNIFRQMFGDGSATII